eukprot:TRINITY_DN3175_c0_g1_i1.p1 TRINITY_DN3175_c0_g1~~TRINITY_DN3175_c0_g1_i1.p1  ORF type:complete len:542 (+),score=116.28 TRINITY_DN3175_c0_g1_i1:427-2052(+)
MATPEVENRTLEKEQKDGMESSNQKAEEEGGELLFCGGTAWDVIGRKGVPIEGNLASPTRICNLIGVNIRFVAAGCASNHCIALDVDGRCYTWGRNDRGQLGHGDLLQRNSPTLVPGLSRYKIVRAGGGRSHTAVVTDDGISLAFGWNKHGQLGMGSIKNEIISSPVQCLVSQAINAVCGADFTVWLSSIKGSTILSAGLPQYGQLGHGTDNEYNSKEGTVKLCYEAQPQPRAIDVLSSRTITKVACGNNHTVAADSDGFVYTWGNGGFGRLGHREQKDEWVPRRVDIFQRANVLPADAVVAAGGAYSACTAAGGQLYMWGRVKTVGDNWMYPKPLLDLSGWNIRCIDFGYSHNICGADESCIGWGSSQYGELGFGPLGPRSSANPRKIDSLEGMHVKSVACGFGHSLIVIDRRNMEDRIAKFEVYDGGNSTAAAKTQDVTDSKEAIKSSQKKRKAGNKSRSNSGSKTAKSRKMEEENPESESSDDDYDLNDNVANGSTRKQSSSRGRGRGRGKIGAKVNERNLAASSGRGKGRGSRNKKR